MAYSAISKARVLINSASGVVSLVVNVVFVFWLYQYLLARIPAEEFAVYPVLMVIMMLGPVIISFFASAISREIIMAYADERTDDVRALHTSIVLALGAFLAALGVIGLIIASQIEHLIKVPPHMHGEVTLMAAIILLDLLVSLFGVPFATAFEVRQKFMQRDIINLSVSFLKIGVTFAFLVGLGPRVLWVPLAAFLANFTGVAVIAILARRMLPEFRIEPARFNPGMVRNLLGFGAWTSLGTFSMLIQQSAAPVLLNILSTPTQVTAYFIGSVFDRRISSLMIMALAPVQPVLVSMSATGDWARLGNTYLRGGRYSLWMAMIMACPMFVFAGDFVDLYLGHEYQETAEVIRITFMVFPFTFASAMLSGMSIATGRIRGFFVGALVMALVNLVSMIVILRLTDLGAVGAAAAQACTQIVAQLTYFWPLGLRLAGLRFGQFARKVLLLGLLPSAGGLLIWVPSELSGLAQTWTGFFACGIAGALAYALTTVLFCLSPDEKQGLQGMRTRFRRRIA